ncbi:polysaccharide deacetylase family protein [Sphingobium nicotianae]|uniref:Polysaccharide deacetylase family protein n=1 Tax=Sphingobium nicotianae TaxID=2782607 RepID=A0A9X1AJ13_9SPHN|nr:polysaccharide deacetylase family protein [Sphingobium nicotianae]MBT2185566.1 polysaccharide deacetylase family protein [Sphingobium nicotianae]
MSMASSAANLLDRPPAAAAIAWPPAMGRRFMLWIDTEEEFDWAAPFNRNATQVSVTSGMARFQRFIAGAGVRPVYVTDYAVIEDPAANALMREWIAEGSADIGAHLHPWVTPPHQEEVNNFNSYSGNLPPALERAKLIALRNRIEERLGIRPIAYRAGRYGVGAHTAALLEEAGFRIDSSVRSRFDYRGQHGPDFTGMPLHPYRAGPQGKLIELPLSTAYVGHLGHWGEKLLPRLQRAWRLSGAFSRSGLLARVPLTPEGVSATECCAAIDSLIAEDVPVLSLSFHSPTLEAGHTPYTRSPADIEGFYRWWDTVLAHLARRNIRPLSQDELLAAI